MGGDDPEALSLAWPAAAAVGPAGSISIDCGGGGRPIIQIVEYVLLRIHDPNLKHVRYSALNCAAVPCRVGCATVD